MKKIGYHYCSVETFMEIIKNKKLWLSHARMMNDKLECMNILNIFEIVIQNINLSDNYKKIISTKIKKVCESREDYPYILCLSKSKDLLSQWRAYGDKGNGVAIGFDLSKIPHRNLLGKGDASSDLIIDEVCYKEKTISEILEKMLETIPYLSEKLHDEDKVISTISNFFGILASFSKNSKFSEEKEYRICYFPSYRYLLKNLNNENFTLDNHLDIKFRSKNSEIISYFEYELSDSAISEIILGPTCKINKNQLNLFLSKYLPNIGIKNRVIKSEIPLTY